MKLVENTALKQDVSVLLPAYKTKYVSTDENIFIDEKITFMQKCLNSQ